MHCGCGSSAWSYAGHGKAQNVHIYIYIHIHTFIALAHSHSLLNVVYIALAKLALGMSPICSNWACVVFVLLEGILPPF